MQPPYVVVPISKILYKGRDQYQVICKLCGNEFDKFDIGTVCPVCGTFQTLDVSGVERNLKL